LLGIDAIARTNFSGADTCHFTSADGIENGGPVRGELERVTVTTGYEDGAAALFFFCGSSGEEIIRFISRRLRVLKAAGGRCQSKILNTWSGHRTAQIDPEKCSKINGHEIRF